MNRLILFAFITFFISISESHCQNWIFSTVIKGSNIEPKYSTVDNSNNIYIYSTFTDTLYTLDNMKSYGVRDMILKKLNSQGEVMWHKHIGSTKNDNAGGITLDIDNNVYILGTFFGNCRFTPLDSVKNTGNGDVFLAKYNSDGDFEWAKRICSSSTAQGSTDLKFDGISKLVTTGFYSDSLIIGSSSVNSDTLLGNSNTSNFIAVFDLNGELQWSKRILGTFNLSRIVKTDISQNGYYFGGHFQGNLILDVGTISSYAPTTYDAFLYKTDFNGNGQWVRRIRGLNTENFRTLTTDEYDNVYVLGNYGSPSIFVDSTETISKTFTGNTGGFDTFLAKYNRSGILQWFLRKGSTAKDLYNDFVVRNNIIYATGYFGNQIIFNNDTLKTTSSNISDAFLAAFNEIGDPIAGVSIQGTDNDKITPIVNAGTIVNMDASSRAYVSGYYKSQQIKIGDQTYTSNNVNKSDLFFAIYEHPFKAVITDERQVSCFGLSDGMLKVTPYFGAPPYTYSWSHNAALNQPVADNLPAGSYTVTITDANNKVAAITAQVTQSALLAISEIVTPVSCSGFSDGAIDITVTGGKVEDNYAYNWTSLDGSGIEPLIEDQSGLASGTYTIVVKDDNNCSATSDIIVSQPQPINYKGSTVTSLNGTSWSINLNVSGGNIPYDFSWTGPDPFTAGTEDLSGLTLGGLYTIAITDDKDCISDTSFVVNDGTTLIAQITAKTDVLCFGELNGSATVTVTNGVDPITFEWSDLPGVTSGNNIRTGMAAGAYSVLVTDGSAATASATVNIVSPLAAITPVLTAQSLKCNSDNSGVVDLSVTGGTTPYDFAWSNGYTGEDLLNIGAGTYTVVITDANECTIQPPSADVTQPAAIGLDISLTGSILCNGDNTVDATANITGGSGSFSYLWNDPGTQVTKTAFELFAGNYTVKVTDENGCSKTASTLITQPDLLSVQTATNDPSCALRTDGSIIPVVSGGTPIYDYTWSNNIFQRLNTDIPAGVYTLTITDANNCTLVQEYTLRDPDPVIIASVDITDPTCLGMADGSLTINASGGNGTYTYSTDGGQNFGTTAIFGSLAAGNYTLTVSDENDCLSEDATATLDNLDTVKIESVIVTDLSCSGKDDGVLTITASGGTGVYTYSADGGLNYTGEAVMDQLEQGEYTVKVLDGNNCPSENYLATIGKSEGCELIIFDAFSPNEDGKNDVWNIGNIDNMPSCTVKIFNLWGIAVFSSSGYGTPWDGKYNGNDLPSGTYYYVIDPGDGSGTLTGAVSIVK